MKELSALLDRWYVPEERTVGKVSPVTAGPKPGRKPPTKQKGKEAPEKKTPATPIELRKPPNFLVLYADDQRDHTLGCAGHPIVKTPNIDRLANQGVRFENAFVSTSTCWVGRSSLFTSTYERKHLYRVTPGPLNPALRELLFCRSQNGRLSYWTPWQGTRQHCRRIRRTHVGRAAKNRTEAFFKKQPDGSMRHETQILGDWAIDFLKEQPEDQPFCLQVSFNATHAEDGDKRPGIGHYPWPKVTDGMYEGQRMPLPPLNDPSIYETQPDFLKKSINRQRYFWLGYRREVPDQHAGIL